MQGIELLLPVYNKDEVQKIQSPFFLRRMDYFGKRLYYEIDDELNPTFYLSTTSFIKSVLPENQFLTSWKIDTALYKDSKEGMEQYVKQTADYGTLMHICIAAIVKSNKFNWSELLVVANDFAAGKIDQPTFRFWLKDLQKDLLAFCKWVVDYNVDIISVEFPIKYRGIATSIDLVCELDVERKGFFGEVYKTGEKKGQPKETKVVERKIAIVDLKSGKKGFYDSHEAQLELCKVMWNSYFEGTKFEVEKIYNWSPTDWLREPNYNFKDQTFSKFAGKTDLLFDLGEMYGIFDFEKFMVESNIEFTLGEQPVFEIKNIREKIKEYEYLKSEEI